MDSVEQPIIDQAGQLGVVIDEFEARILTAGGALVLSDQIVGDERRIERMRLDRTSLNNGYDQLKISHEIKKRYLSLEKQSNVNNTFTI